MKSSCYVLLTTFPNRTAARRVASALLKKRLVACVHLAAAGESHYWWKGKLEKAGEIAATFKTAKKTLSLAIQNLKQLHPYEVPEILALRVEAGNADYLRWVQKETRTF
ncbi:MAG: divalent-cation tolerance protein CutA [Verrucomicrobiae bacterium]|nr:divalent-cation tolerance protein CutA [Verrucomicrobiae bacterium]